MFQPKNIKPARVWATEFYDDSNDLDNVVSKLSSEVICNAFISPCHKDDVNPDNQSKKKAHYHVELMFEGKKSYEQVKEIVDFLGCVGCYVVTSKRGYARYLCHLDNPEKALYDINLVTQIGDESYFDVISSVADKTELMLEICDWCYQNEIFDYWYLVLFAYNNGLIEWGKAISSQPMFYRAFLQSLEHFFKVHGTCSGFTFDLGHDVNVLKQMRRREKELEQAKLALMDNRARD